MSDVPARIAIAGITGRMGGTIAARIAEAEDLTLIGGTAARAREFAVPGLGRMTALPAHEARALFAEADVVIDVSSADALGSTLDAAAGALAGKAFVVGTTGFDANAAARLEVLAREAAVLVAANFSIGVNVLLGLVERAARALDAAHFDAEVVETHHRRKVDAPSGTALELGRAIARGRDEEFGGSRRDGRSGNVGARPRGEVGFHAVRGGGVIGEHRVLFLGESERIELAHAAGDRTLFADGALAAARWMAGRTPGRYTMSQVLGL